MVNKLVAFGAAFIYVIQMVVRVYDPCVCTPGDRRVLRTESAGHNEEGL